MEINTEAQNSPIGELDTAKTNSSKITPFLWFNGHLEEAVKFYSSVFKNAKIINISYIPDGIPGSKGKAISATFQLNGQEFMALDGGPHYSFTPAISFFVHCATQEEVDYYWEKLSNDGEPGKCGWLKDKYGLSWQIVPEILGKLLGGPDRSKAGNAMKAMMKMGKLDIQELEDAYNGG